jgi:hypothetical protein
MAAHTIRICIRLQPQYIDNDDEIRMHSYPLRSLPLPPVRRPGESALHSVVKYFGRIFESKLEVSF